MQTVIWTFTLRTTETQTESSATTGMTRSSPTSRSSPGPTMRAVAWASPVATSTATRAWTWSSPTGTENSTRCTETRHRRRDPIGFRYSTNQLGLRGLGNQQTGWGVSWSDLDNDSDLDLFIANGHVPMTDLAEDGQPLRLYENRSDEGLMGQIRDASAETGVEGLGTHNARGVAAADYDNDGDIDLAINVIGGDALLLRNESPPGNSVTIDLGGTRPGTIAEIGLPDGRILVRESHAGSSYLSSDDPRFVVGIGDAGHVSAVTVRSPDGAEAVFTDVPAGTTITVAPGNGG